MEQNHLRGKIVVIICISLFSVCFSGLSLFKPQILTSIIQYEHPNYDNSTVESRASFYKSFLDGGSAVVSLFALPMLGSLSDIFGRKKIMIVGAVALTVSIVVYKISYSMNSLWILYLSCLLSIQMANQISSIAYMSDIAEDEKEKTKNFGLILAAFMAGIIVGSLGLGYISEKFGINISLYVLFGVSVALTAIIVVVFREDTQFYAERINRKFDIRQSNPFAAMKLVLGTNSFVTTMAVIYTINFLAISDSNTMYLYTENRYSWGSFQNGMIGAVVGVATMLWQGLGVGILLKYMSRTSILPLTMLVAVCIHATQGFSPYGWLFMLAAAAGGFVAIGFPLMQSLFSEDIPSEKQGMAFGGLSSMSSIATLLGELTTENTLAYCLDKYFFTCPGTAFYMCSFLFLVDAIICFVIYCKYPQKKQRKDDYVSINDEEKYLQETTGKM